MTINPYLTVIEADEYFATRLDVEAWEDATEPNQEKAILMASDMIDQLDFTRPKADPAQLNAFPLDGQDEVPDNVKKACCELALNLLEGKDGFAQFKDGAVRAEGYSSVRISYDSTFKVYNEMLGISSFRAYKYLLPWLAMPSETITLNRV